MNFRGELLQLRVLNAGEDQQNSTPTLHRGSLNLLEFKTANKSTRFALLKDFVCWTDEDKVTYMILATKEIGAIDLKQ